jgi:glutathione S-transferase
LTPGRRQKVTPTDANSVQPLLADGVGRKAAVACRAPAALPLNGLATRRLMELPNGRADPHYRREWLTETFSVADILIADVLRVVDRFDRLAGHPACRAYVARATARPAFVKAHADQMKHFAAAD